MADDKKEEKNHAAQGGTMQSFFYENIVGTDQAPQVAHRVPKPPSQVKAKVCGYVSPQGTNDEFQLLAQMGVAYCFTWFQKFADVTAAKLSMLQKQAAQHGIHIYNVGCLELAKSWDIIMATEHRDEVIEQFKQFVYMLSAAGIRLTTFTWEATGRVYSTGSALVRGGAEGRSVDAAILAQLPPVEGTCSEADMWENMAFFLQAMLPALEKSDVSLAIHPNDPPLAHVGGVPCLMRSVSAFERVFSMCHDSAYVGMEFCCGTWMEGLRLGQEQSSLCGHFGDTADDLLSALRGFCTSSKVRIVHLRNCTASLPRFAETFIDDGFMDVHDILHVLAEAGYQGV